MSTVVQPAPGQSSTPPLIADFEACVPETFAERMGVVVEWLRIKSLTAELFPGQTRLEVVRDPELADQYYIVMHVTCTGGVEDVVARQMDWINRSIDAAGRKAGFFHVSVEVVPC